MPYVIVKSAYQLGQTIDATLRDLGVADRRSDVPVKVTILERTLMIDGGPCAIISTVGENDTTTFLVDAGRKSIANRARRQRLARASELLAQLTCVLTALEPGDNVIEIEYFAGLLEAVAGWLNSEREKVAPRSIVAERSPS